MHDPGGLHFAADGAKMIPVEGAKLSQLVMKALANIEHFDFIQFEQWLAGRSEQIQKLARTCPPAHLYRVKGGPLVRKAKAPIYGVVTGYATVEGAVNPIDVQILGMRLGETIGLHPDWLEDVTEAGRQRKLEYGDLG